MYSVYEPSSAKRSRTGSFRSYGSVPSTMSEFNSSTTSVKASSARSKRGYVSLGKFKNKRDKAVAAIARKVCKRVLAVDDEVKYLIWGTAGATVGQTSTVVGPTTTSGHFAAQLTMPTQGSAANQRIGDKIRLKSLKLSFQFRGLANTCNAKLLKFLLVKVVAPLPSWSVAQVFSPNPAIDVANGGTGAGSVVSIFDYSSTLLRNPDFINSYTILYEKDMVVEASESNTGAAGTSDRQMFATFNLDIPMKNMSYEDSGGSLAGQQIGWYLFCDSGDKGAVNPSILGIPENTASTGLSFTTSARLDWTDA